MRTYAKTKDGLAWVLFIDNTSDETMDLIPIKYCDDNGNYDTQNAPCVNYPYSKIKVTDTNRAAIGI